ncbi:hypothetical protein [Microvirga massiliensis]|uniref:hypothetical protein n=1 Tax=Microvirga massiliensis TaxID=1033741 RepID=UPI000A9553C7|nr:hypothetical protein [Microvirga massiliensis]
MSNPDEIEIELCGAEQPLHNLVDQLKDDSNDVEVVSVHQEKDETKLAFELGTLATAILIIKGAYYATALAKKIHEWMKESGSKKYPSGLRITRSQSHIATISVKKKSRCSFAKLRS